MLVPRGSNGGATFPALAILALVLGFNLLGDGIGDALDPRLGKMT